MKTAFHSQHRLWYIHLKKVECFRDNIINSRENRMKFLNSIKNLEIEKRQMDEKLRMEEIEEAKHFVKNLKIENINFKEAIKKYPEFQIQFITSEKIKLHKW